MDCVVKLYKILILGLVVLTAGCAASPDVGSDYDPFVRFSELKTFSWQAPAADGRVSDPVESRVRAAVVEQLSAKGFDEVSTDSDFQVTYWAQVTAPRSSNVSMGMGMSFGGSSGGSRSRRGSVSISTNTANVSLMREGTLVLNFLKDDVLVWQGSSTEAVEGNLSSEERDRRVSAAVERILAKFPPDTNP